MSKLRVLVDTNILLSGMMWNGNEARLLDMSIAGQVHLLVPEFVLQETRRVLNNKFPKRSPALDQIASLIDYEILSPPSKEAIESARQVLRDASDVEVLASILQFRPDYAVSGDKDLLTADVCALFPVCTCAELLVRIGAED